MESVDPSSLKIAKMEITDRIQSTPGKCGGRPCVRDLWIRVTDVLELLASRMSREQILAEHPSLQDEDITACLLFAVGRIDHPVIGRLRTSDRTARHR